MLRHPHLSHLIPTPQPPSATLFPYTTLFRSNEDGSARYMPAGVRVLEKSLLREYATDEVVACFPDDLDKFIGPKTRVVAVSTHKDRKSTRLNSSHQIISYAVFCLKKKKTIKL